MKFKYISVVVLTSFLIPGFLFAQEKDIPYYINQAPFKMPVVTVPVFPDKQFSIVDYHAVGDGHTLNTQAFASAIQACNEAGGGMVIVPSGIWLTGPIELKSNVNLHVERGAIIQFTSDHTQYPMINSSAKSTRLTTASPIHSYDQKNIAITGEGIIDGFGESWRPVKKEKLSAGQWSDLVKSGGVVSEDGKIWWPSKEAYEGPVYLKSLARKPGNPTPEDMLPARDYLRPYMILLSYCENILIEGVTMRNSPKFVFYPNNCTNLTVRYANVYNEWYAQNGDGMDISACKNVIIYKCNVNVGDDAICMKSSGRSSDPDAANLENILIAACNVYHGHGGFVIGSNTDGGMNNIFVTDMNMVGTDIGIRVKSSIQNGGVVKNIYIENIYMSHIRDEAVSVNTYYENRPAGSQGSSNAERKRDERIPDFSGFILKNIYCYGAHTAMSLTGMPEMPLKNFHFENMIISADEGITGSDLENFTWKNVKILNDSDPVFSFNNARNIQIDQCPKMESSKVFLKASGAKTNSILISGSQLPKADEILQLGDEVDKNAVTVK